MAFVLDRNSKADTRFFCDAAGSGAAALAVDLSQYRTDLTNNTTYLTSTDTRLAVRSPREISVVIDIATANSRVVLNWGNVAGTTYIYRITLAAGGNVQFGHNNALLTTVVCPNIAAGARSYVLHWSTDYDERAATYYSEFAICDVTSGDWTIARVTHSQPNAPAGGDQFNISGYGAGSTLFTGGLTAYDFVRVGCRFHSTTEAREDWVTESSAPSVDGVQLDVELAPTSTSFFTADPAEDVSDALLDEETFAGPIELATVINAAANRKRLYGPIINFAPNAPAAVQDTYTPAKFYKDYLCLGFVFEHRWPSYTTRVKVRIHAQTWIAAGAPGGTTVSVTLHVYAAVKFGGSVTSVASLLVTDNHTSTGVGQWYNVGAYLLSGVYSVVGIGYQFGVGTGHAYLRAKIKGVTFEPYEDD